MMDEGRALKFAPPESPFRDDKYLELVAKIMLRDAITERKAGIGIFQSRPRSESLERAVRL